MVFPCEDGGAQLVIANSVFTHLLETDATPLPSRGRKNVEPGRQRLTQHPRNPAEGRRFSGNETRIDISPAYFAELAAAAGLSVKRRVDEFCGQMLFVFSRKS